MSLAVNTSVSEDHRVSMIWMFLPLPCLWSSFTDLLWILIRAGMRLVKSGESITANWLKRGIH